MPIRTEREYRSMPMMHCRAADGGEPSYVVEGYASTFGERYEIWKDLDGNNMYEEIMPGAFDECDMSDVIFQFDHCGRVFARNKNGTMTMTVDEHGLLVAADLGTTENARNMYEDIRAGLIDQMSFAFTIEDEAYDKATRTYKVKKIGKLYDVSAVSIPANPGTEISAKRMAMLNGVNEQEKAERLKQARHAEKEKRRKLLLTIRIAKAREE